MVSGASSILGTPLSPVGAAGDEWRAHAGPGADQAADAGRREWLHVDPSGGARPLEAIEADFLAALCLPDRR